MNDFSAVRVLAIDDHDLQRRVVVRRLAEVGVVHVDEANSGEAAVQRLGASSYDLVLCDLDMPGLDGLGVMRHLVGLRSASAFALVSAADAVVLECAELMCENQRLRFLGALEKPITADQLTHLLMQALQPVQVHEPVEPLPLADIRRGMTANEFVAYFQPIVDVETGAVRSVEALARWLHPERGVLPPAYFLSALEQHDGMDALTWNVLTHILRLIQRTDSQGRELDVSLNLSAGFLARIGVADTLSGRLAECGLPPRRVMLEVTESVALTTEPIALENLARLRLRGHYLTADDFGTAYASLRQLVRAPFHKMKFDYVFVRDALRHDRAWTILRAAIAMARDLRMETVLEGVETAEQGERLVALGATSHQGFHYARPMAADELVAWLARLPK